MGLPNDHYPATAFEEIRLHIYRGGVLAICLTYKSLAALDELPDDLYVGLDN
ncbi:hypothetical protein ECTHUN299_55400 [Escherichia coli]|nr:hypothetical protein ECTHUN299_55400 [Escherichia coli]